MTTPVDEIDQPKYNIGPNAAAPDRRSSDEEGTVVAENGFRNDESHSLHMAERQTTHATTHEFPRFLSVDTALDGSAEDPNHQMQSPSQTREQAHRLDDDLRMLQVERQVSQRMDSEDGKDVSRARTKSMTRERSRRQEPEDDFDIATNPLHERAQVYKPPEHPQGNFAKFVKKIHNSSFLVRYVTYITPLVLIILIPLLIGALWPAVKANDPNVGGVQLIWFCIWLEIVWLTLWLGRIISKLLPWPTGIIASLFTNNAKKWRDMSKQLELPFTLFFWLLAVEISFLPTMTHHQVDGSTGVRNWMNEMNKVLVSFLVAAVLNLVAKILIQLIAISFHLRTYQDRIEMNKFQIGSLTKLYQYSKVKIAELDSDFEAPSGQGPGSGARTPAYIEKAQKNTKEAFNKFGDVAGKIAGDFTGKAVKQSGHPGQVVLSLLRTNGGSQVLARRLYRTFGREDTQTIFQEDLKSAFENDDEADAAFSMFDKDMNGDISMEELEAVCVEIGRERKSITASLKDLDSVVSKLDSVFMFVVAVVFILVLISLISTSAAGVLTSAGSAVLALSWLFSTTAQEFLQSCIFVFVKHPFDVGDRITVYGNTGSSLKGDDYFVKEISLLYTEFKKMEGHVVQAPNSYLNTLFILNMRRSGGLAEAVPMIFKFGTTLEQIEGLRNKLLDFVKAEKREYQANILTELRSIDEAHSITLNIIFFFKSNWQNELLRLQRRNKFICAMMVAMQELGIEGPRMRFPGQQENFPVYMQSLPYNPQAAGHGGTPDNPAGIPLDQQPPPLPENSTVGRESSVSRSRNTTRARGESLAAMGRRLDFSLGMSSIAPGDLVGDIHADRDSSKSRIPINITSPSPAPGRMSQDPERERSASVAQASGRKFSLASIGPGSLKHRGTDPIGRSSSSMHRNRFFGRTSHDSHRMEAGMAGIPEDSANQSGQVSGRLDPRSGLVSPAAIRMDSLATQETTRVAEPAPVQQQPFGTTQTSTQTPAQTSNIPTTATQDWEMTRFV